MATTAWQGVWREPSVESDDLFPGVVVCDDRVTGSLTFGPTRVPLWAPAAVFLDMDDYLPPNWFPDPRAAASAGESLIGNLLQLRGEFARLLCVLADEERREHLPRARRLAWWEKKRSRRRVLAQLKLCVDCLTALESESHTQDEK